MRDENKLRVCDRNMRRGLRIALRRVRGYGTGGIAPSATQSSLEEGTYVVVDEIFNLFVNQPVNHLLLLLCESVRFYHALPGRLFFIRAF